MSAVQKQAAVNAKRRRRTELREQQRDLAEQHELELATATSHEERERIRSTFAAKRSENRNTEIKEGFRLPGASILMQQVIWVRWIEVAIEHELQAKSAFNEIASGRTEALATEFRASLVAVSASAHAIEALYGDIKYLLPEQKDKGRRY